MTLNDVPLRLLPPLRRPTLPCHVHVAEEGAESVCGHDGGGVCVRGASRVSQLAGGTGHWAPRGECVGRGTLPSEPGMEGREPDTLLDYHILINTLMSVFSCYDISISLTMCSIYY